MPFDVDKIEIPKPFKTPVPVNIKPPRPVKPVKTPTAAQLQGNTNPDRLRPVLDT